MEKTRLKVRVNPRSSRNQIVGWQDDVLQIKLTAPPVEGAANKACVEFLADQLGVKKSQITLTSGATSRISNHALPRGVTIAYLRIQMPELRREVCAPGAVG